MQQCLVQLGTDLSMEHGVRSRTHLEREGPLRPQRVAQALRRRHRVHLELQLLQLLQRRVHRVLGRARGCDGSGLLGSGQCWGIQGQGGAALMD